MSLSLNADELASEVNQWCEQNAIKPASGQVGEAITVRNVRFYRTLGLVDRPEHGGRGFGEKHKLQLIAIRLLQAKGLPLHKIQELLFGRTTDELRQIQRRGLADWEESRTKMFEPSPTENWCVTPLNEEFMLVSRKGRAMPGQIQQRIKDILESATNPRGQSRANNRSNQ